MASLEQDVPSRNDVRLREPADANRSRPRLHDFVLGLLARREPAPLPAQFAYRLRAWPALRSTRRTAGVMQALTRMELGPVSRRWFVAACRLPPREAALLLEELVRHGYVQELSLPQAAAASGSGEHRSPR